MSDKQLHLFLSALLMITSIASSSAMSAEKGRINPPTITSLNAVHPLALQQQLKAALEAKNSEYAPRTEHKTPEGRPLFTNRLLLESSPYLLQHAHNPVNWYSWSDEALLKAKSENKPIFLSIGYSTCHWCHVMERESFENLEIAAFLNKHFINIKVDREQRPDVDQTYMTAAALLSGHTGWPLSAFITSDGAPFYAASYFPPQQFLSLLNDVQDLWATEPEKIINEGQKTLAVLKKVNAQIDSDQATSDSLKGIATTSAQEWLNLHDEFSGGFGTAPKFPNETVLFLLLDQAVRHQDEEMLSAVLRSLDAMQQGGIYDQVGGGFHRYATDPNWLIPHFEKMLYNQAQLARVYLYAWKVTANPLYRRTAEQTLNYVLRDLKHTDGPFYAATDADSDGGEGLYFLWDNDQLKHALNNPEQFALASQLFGLTEGSNFSGSNILYLPTSLPEFAINQQLNAFEFIPQLDLIQQKLLQHRMKRTPPHLDDKVITAWNGMLIRSLAEASDILQKPNYAEAAITAAEWLWKHHQTDGILVRSSWKGQHGPAGTLEDYANLAQAYIALYDVSHDPLWLVRSKTLTETLLNSFWEQETGQLYLSAKDSLLPLRIKSNKDNATLSATAITYELLTQLSNRTPNQKYRVIAEQIFTAESGTIQQRPMQYSYLLTAYSQANKGNLKHLQYAAQGALKATLQKKGQALKLEIELQPGWHINAHTIEDKRLIQTTVSADWITDVEYPSSSPLSVAFMPKPIPVYSEQFTFNLTSSAQPSELQTPVHFHFQACSQSICLPPESLYFAPQ